MLRQSASIALGALAALALATSPGATRATHAARVGSVGSDEARGALGDTPVGEPLPDLRLPTIDGETLSLSSFRGQKLLLIEFASW